MTRVLVAGGRKYADMDRLREVLGHIHGQVGITNIIHGGATGADTLAGVWARENRVSVVMFPADWDRFGKAAGPIRNRKMLDVGQPDLVVLFPGGTGTANMEQQALLAGLQVISVAG